MSDAPHWALSDAGLPGSKCRATSITSEDLYACPTDMPAYRTIDTRTITSTKRLMAMYAPVRRIRLSLPTAEGTTAFAMTNTPLDSIANSVMAITVRLQQWRWNVVQMRLNRSASVKPCAEVSRQ